jgi:intracellular sulfur oxidation DsrE/DsrF family protein
MRDSLKAGVGFFACANTMAARNWTLGDLLPGFVVAEKGAVVLLADLQAQGGPIYVLDKDPAASFGIRSVKFNSDMLYVV